MLAVQLDSSLYFLFYWMLDTTLTANLWLKVIKGKRNNILNPSINALFSFECHFGIHSGKQLLVFLFLFEESIMSEAYMARLIYDGCRESEYTEKQDNTLVLPTHSQVYSSTYLLAPQRALFEKK